MSQDPARELGAPSVDPTPSSERYIRVRGLSEALSRRLSAEDAQVQSMPDASPTKWHLAHTTWFFETFVLADQPGYEVHHERFSYLFNSYYDAVGGRHARPERGLLTRPTLGEVYDYRAYVDDHMRQLLERRERDGAGRDSLWYVLELGLNHEQQHQELILTDIQHALSRNPLHPSYAEVLEPVSGGAPRADAAGESAGPLFSTFDGGLVDIGHDGPGFAFDNESPRHKAFAAPFALARCPVSNRELMAFIDDGGYEDVRHWLSEGWDTCQQLGWSAPLYWTRRDGEWFRFSLRGLTPVEPEAPVCHLSFYEADAFASWAGARLPTEVEWELAAAQLRVPSVAAGGVGVRGGNFVESGHLRPVPPNSFGDADSDAPAQLLGDVWEWTASPYTAYPGYRPADGALGEYNGKFMCNQFVLRGGSCATSRSHIRTTYRNFFSASARWQFTGLRLAKDIR